MGTRLLLDRRRRKEAEDIAVPSLLDSLWSKKKEVYLIPQAVGVNGSFYQYNADYLSNAGIDPKKLTTMDAHLEAAEDEALRARG